MSFLIFDDGLKKFIGSTQISEEFSIFFTKKSK
jgi:hypothetical protein